MPLTVRKRKFQANSRAKDKNKSCGITHVVTLFMARRGRNKRGPISSIIAVLLLADGPQISQLHPIIVSRVV